MNSVRHVLMRASRAVIGVVTIAIVACVPYGDVGFNISGHVLDPEGLPIEGATVQIWVNDKPAHNEGTATTDGSGKYRVIERSCPCDFAFELRITKPGCQPHTLKLRGRRANSLRRYDVTLWRDSTHR